MNSVNMQHSACQVHFIFSSSSSSLLLLLCTTMIVLSTLIDLFQTGVFAMFTIWSEGSKTWHVTVDCTGLYMFTHTFACVHAHACVHTHYLSLCSFTVSHTCFEGGGVKLLGKGQLFSYPHSPPTSVSPSLHRYDVPTTDFPTVQWQSQPVLCMLT